MTSDHDYKLMLLEELEKNGDPNGSFPDVFFTPGSNPLLSVRKDPEVLSFKQTRETLLNVDDYKAFLSNAVSTFRKTRFYKNYKGFLMGLGMNRCQVHGNITDEMATVEMHHNQISLFDIAFIITSHITNTYPEGLTTFDLVYLLKKAHKEHKVQLVMLSLTPHQLYHNTDELNIPPEQCIGNWFEFLKEYRYGISKEIAYKIIFYLKQFKDHDFGNNYDILKISKEISDWSELNDRISFVDDGSGGYDPIGSNSYPDYYGYHGYI